MRGYSGRTNTHEHIKDHITWIACYLNNMLENFQRFLCGVFRIL